MEAIRDAIAVLALGAIGAGLWWIYPPSALIGVGSIVLYGITRR